VDDCDQTQGPEKLFASQDGFMRRNTVPQLLLFLPDRENLPLEAFPVHRMLHPDGSIWRRINAPKACLAKVETGFGIKTCVKTKA